MDASGIWVSLCGKDSVVRIDPQTGTQTRIGVGSRPWSLALGGGRLWVAHQGDGSLYWIDTATRQVTGRRMGLGPPRPPSDDPTGDGVVYTAGLAWLASHYGAHLHAV